MGIERHCCQALPRWPATGRFVPDQLGLQQHMTILEESAGPQPIDRKRKTQKTEPKFGWNVNLHPHQGVLIQEIVSIDQQTSRPDQASVTSDLPRLHGWHVNALQIRQSKLPDDLVDEPALDHRRERSIDDDGIEIQDRQGRHNGVGHALACPC